MGGRLIGEGGDGREYDRRGRGWEGVLIGEGGDGRAFDRRGMGWEGV